MTPDEVVDLVTADDVASAVQAALDELGLTYDEIKEQASKNDFSSVKARLLWQAMQDLAQTA